MKIRLRREMLISLLVLLPYLENNFTQKYLQWYFEESYIRSITVISFFVISIVFLGSVTKKTQPVANKSIKYTMLAFVVYAAITSLFSSTNLLVSSCSWLWLATPILFALIACRCCAVSKAKLNLVMKYAVIWFVLYLSLVLVYYVFVHHLFIDQTVRMKPRGGGAVIFGYTIALFFILTVIYRNEFKTLPYYLILAVLTVGSVGTATRGSVWLVALFWVANFLVNKFGPRQIVIFLLLIPVGLYLSTLDFRSLETTTFVGFGRLFNIHSYRRITSTSSILEVFGEFSVLKKVFGMGLGEFFPYQKWLISVNDVENNMFNYMGHTILVQPHNSFLYILMECGLLGFCGFALIFIFSVKNIMSHRSSRWIYKVIFVGAVIVLNCLDSVFFVQPGAAFNFWLLLLLVLDDDSAHKKHSPIVIRSRRNNTGELLS